VGTAATREYQDAGVGGFESIQVCGELTFREWMVQSFGVFFKGPVWSILVYISPMETGTTVRRVTEIINIVSFGPKAVYHFGVIGVSPAGGNVDHNQINLNKTKISISIKKALSFIMK
jgi:hypothetical protein